MIGVVTAVGGGSSRGLQRRVLSRALILPVSRTINIVNKSSSDIVFVVAGTNNVVVIVVLNSSIDSLWCAMVSRVWINTRMQTLIVVGGIGSRIVPATVAIIVHVAAAVKNIVILAVRTMNG